MSGRVDEIEFIDLAVLCLIIQLDGARLDRDAAFAFDLHIVEQLLLHLAGGDALCRLQNAVGQRAFAVVDMGNDRKIADLLLSCHSSSGKPNILYIFYINIPTDIEKYYITRPVTFQENFYVGTIDLP